MRHRRQVAAISTTDHGGIIIAAVRVGGVLGIAVFGDNVVLVFR